MEISLKTLTLCFPDFEVKADLDYVVGAGLRIIFDFDGERWVGLTTPFRNLSDGNMYCIPLGAVKAYLDSAFFKVTIRTDFKHHRIVIYFSIRSDPDHPNSPDIIINAFDAFGFHKQSMAKTFTLISGSKGNVHVDSEGEDYEDNGDSLFFD